MGASVEAVGEATRASPARGETAAKAAPDSAPGPETARVDDAAPSLLGDSSSDAASARSPAPVSASRAETRTPPASPSRHAPASVQELLGLRRLVDGGTPLTSAQQRRAESLVKEAVSDGFASGTLYDASRLRLTNTELLSLGLSAPDKPELPSDFDRMPLPKRLSCAQAFIDQLTYNHVGYNGAVNGSTFFSIDKKRPLGRILETARCIERDALPIKCVEAVFLALRLTANWRDVDRVPAAFKTAVAFTDGAGKVRRRCHRHIVLLVRRKGREPEAVSGTRRLNAKGEPTDLGAYGALGISRRASLAHRPMRYGSVSEILTSYREAYEDIGHEVLKVRVGLPVPRDPPDAEVCWRHCCVTVGRLGPGKGAAENGDDDDDDDDDDAEEAVASASSSSKTEKTDDAEAENNRLRTWEEAIAIFDAHDAASRSRKVFDKWRVDGERFVYVAPKEKEKETGRAEGGGANANGARAPTTPAAAAARDADDGSPVLGEPSDAFDVAVPNADDAPRLATESSPSADHGAGFVSGAATGEEALERAESPGAEASAEPPGDP
jgi:hypothetical protein